jgi:hypothetical protein
LTRTLFNILGAQKFKIFIDRLLKREGSIYTNAETIEQLLNKTSLDQFYSMKYLNSQNNDFTAVNVLEIVTNFNNQ